MKTILLLVTLCTLGVNAQEFSFGVDVQSRYVWRGLQFGGEDASIQPGVEYAVGNFAVGVQYSLGEQMTHKNSIFTFLMLCLMQSLLR